MKPKPQGYQTPRFQKPIDLQLSRNESRCAILDLAGHLAASGESLVSQYPSADALQQALGQWLGVDPQRLVITAGGDESIERIVGQFLTPQRPEVVTHAPSFEMVPIYTANQGGQFRSVDWLEGDFPTDALLEQIGPRTGLVVLTSPNNPTGQSIPLEQIRRINAAARQAGARLLLDHAYIEFADEDPTAELLADDQLLQVRTFSKAWGLAGLRVGYLIAPDVELATALRNASGPYPVSGLSLAAACEALATWQDQMRAQVEQIRHCRRWMMPLLKACGGAPIESQGNFVLARFDDADAVWQGLAESGIGVRIFPDNPALQGYLRITCPVAGGDYLRLARALCRLRDINPEPFLQDAGAELLSPVSSAEQVASLDHPAARQVRRRRTTRETDIELELSLDGTGQVAVETGIGFLDHMLTALAFHAGFDLKLHCRGDLEVDDHHTAEDCALALGAAIDEALGPRSGIVRFGYAYAPLDEALARAVVDLSGRPWPEIHLQLQREQIGQWACENITHFFQSLAMSLKCSLHVDVLRGANDHHRAEAAFKALAKALRQAVARTDGAVPSTKGIL